MDENKIELYNRLNNKTGCDDYVPVIETNKGYYMIWKSKVAKCSRESRRRYGSYLESKGSDKEIERFEKLSSSVELDSEKKKGIWFDLEGFVDKLQSEDIDLIKQTIKSYK